MRLKELAERLIGFNTVSPDSPTVEIADFIATYLEGCGFTIERYPYDLGGAKRVNLVARKGGPESFLAFSGHMDTVPFTTADWRMSKDPLKLVTIGDKVYGRGTSDMKLFLAIAMKAGEAVAASELKRPFALVFTSDEEIGCIGARKLVREQKVRLADHIVIGEPTEMVPITLHKGYMYVVVELRGKKGHSSDPTQGQSVVDLALVPVLNRLFTFKKKLEATKDARFAVPYPTMNIGTVQTPGSAKNIVPSYCRIELDIRPIPGQDPEELFSILRNYVENGIFEMTGIKVRVRYARKASPPMETPTESPFTRAVMRIEGKQPQAVSYNTEGGIFNAEGFQSIIWGPGSIREAHKPDEFVEAKYFDPSVVDRYSALIRHMCT